MDNEKRGMKEFFFPEEVDVEPKAEVESENENNTEAAFAAIDAFFESTAGIILESAIEAIKVTVLLLIVLGILALALCSNAGNYAKGIFVKGIVFVCAYFFFLIFTAQYFEFSKENAEKNERKTPVLPRILNRIAGDSLTVLLLSALIFGGYVFAMNSYASVYEHLPFHNEVKAFTETLEEKYDALKEDMKHGAYEKQATYEVELTQVNLMNMPRGGTRYIYALKNDSGETAMFYDFGNLYSSICAGHEVGEKIPLPITIQIDLMQNKTNGEQDYFYGETKLQRMS